MKNSNFNFTDPVLTLLEFRPKLEEVVATTDAHTLKNDFEIEISRNENYNEAIVTLGLAINGVDAAPFILKAKMTSLFSWGNNDFTEDEIKILLTKNAPSLLLSYLRPLVATITNASPFPAYNLPFFDLRGDF